MRARPWIVLLIASGAAHAGPPDFTLTADNEAELKALSRSRCGGEAHRVDGPDAGSALQGTFVCSEHPGIDVTDSLGEAHLVVRGRVTKIDTPNRRRLGDPSPLWMRATLTVSRTLKGRPIRTVSFLFIGATDPQWADAPKPVLGEEGVWILSRGSGPVRDLMMLGRLDAHPANAEKYLAQLLEGTACPVAAEQNCSAVGAVCSGKDQVCTCELPCGGGAPPPPDCVPQARWVCRPAACATAVAGETCRGALTCEGCWGTRPWTCERGRWRFRQIQGPP